MAKKVLVIGGVAAGMSAASQAKRRSPDTEVVVLESGLDVSYGACGMPYNISDPKREMQDLVVITAGQFREKRGLDVRLEHRAGEIDRSNKTVKGMSPDGNFEIGYDKLVIATGARAVVPDLPGIDLDNVYTFHTLEDGRRLKQALKKFDKPARVLLAGAGYVGLELADALASLGHHVTMIKRKPKLLSWMDQALEDRLLKELEKNSVDLVTGAGLDSIEKSGDLLLVKAGPNNFSADLAVVAVGIRPNSEIASAAGLDTGRFGEIMVDEELKTNDPDIYAAGDCADAFHVVTGKRAWIPLALRANRAGKIAGANTVGAGLKAPPVAGTQVFKLFSLEVAKSGLSLDQARAGNFEPVSIVIHASNRGHAFPGAGKMSVELVADKRSGRLLGGQIVAEEGAAHRIDTIAAALAAKMSAREFGGLDLAYAPPFGPTWDPLLVAATQLIKKLEA
ncbi:MAG: FAD-dependent oxidoreductase [Deltaproteobacteria bacterium]|nr:FAD-dependent oxidoreductase [Deltaproteobacteria bacterium]